MGVLPPVRPERGAEFTFSLPESPISGPALLEILRNVGRFDGILTMPIGSVPLRHVGSRFTAIVGQVAVWRWIFRFDLSGGSCCLLLRTHRVCIGQWSQSVAPAENIVRGSSALSTFIPSNRVASSMSNRLSVLSAQADIACIFCMSGGFCEVQSRRRRSEV